MRLSITQIITIKHAVHAYDQNAAVTLFGSRTNDTTFGGDIDLLIESNTMTSTEKRLLKLNLYDSLGHQKIDVILTKHGGSSPIIDIAKSSGIKL